MGTPKILEEVPWNSLMPAGPQSILILICTTLFLLGAWFMVVEARRRRDFVPLYAFIGGGIAVFYEPLGDTLASVFYPIHGQIGWISLMGRQVPLFIGILYFWYMSVPAVYFLRRLEKGVTKSQIWFLYFMTIILATVIELFGVNTGAWVYYGNHPYLFFGVPLWCAVTYSAFIVTISIGVHLMATNLDRRHQWLIMFGVPVFMVGGHCAAALPAAAAMLSTDNPLWIWLGGTASIAVSFGTCFFATLIYGSEETR